MYSSWFSKNLLHLEHCHGSMPGRPRWSPKFRIWLLQGGGCEGGYSGECTLMPLLSVDPVVSLSPNSWMEDLLVFGEVVRTALGSIEVNKSLMYWCSESRSTD
jgi:hypothetical protein